MSNSSCRWARGVGACLGFAVALVAGGVLVVEPRAADRASIERGRYLIRIAGCNDCHTAGYLISEGRVPEARWLLGDTFGWHGPWGTTYGSNLRIYMNGISEDDWVLEAKTLKRRPPMPWFNLNNMEEADLRAIHRFVLSLGAPGEPARTFLEPGETPPPPFASFPSPPK